MAALTGFTPLYRRRLTIALKTPVALAGQMLLPVLWVLVVAPALTRAFGGFARDVDYLSYVCIGQVVFVVPFSAMFAGLTVVFDKDWGVLRELLVAPIRRSTIPFANTGAVLTVAIGQFVLILGLALARGARFHTTPPRAALALLAVSLLAIGVYGIAELLAYTLRQPQTFGTLIPAIGATPYALCGAIFPISALPAGVKQVAWALPWTHCVDLLRFGLLGGRASGLDQIWSIGDGWPAALLSLGVLAGFAVLTQSIALRRFRRATAK